MARYSIITEMEMDNIFKKDKNWEKEYSGNVREIVYTKCLKSRPNIQVKIYSSVNKNSGLSAKVGADAIRVCAIDIVRECGIIKTRRINRVDGWEDRLVNRVTEVWSQLVK